MAPFVCLLPARAAPVPHNRRMNIPRVLASLVVFAVLALAGCEQAAPGARDPMPGASSSSVAMEFRGRRPCVDCRGIDAWLRLEQDGEIRRYALVERYLSAGGERRFEERGDWRDDGDLLRLRSDEGGQRTYARLPGHGGLQARASDGGPLAAADDDVMMPTTFDNTR